MEPKNVEQMGAQERGKHLDRQKRESDQRRCARNNAEADRQAAAKAADPWILVELRRGPKGELSERRVPADLYSEEQARNRAAMLNQTQHGLQYRPERMLRNLTLTRGGKPVLVMEDDVPAHRYIHGNHSFSLDWAQKHEGYRLRPFQEGDLEALVGVEGPVWHPGDRVTWDGYPGTVTRTQVIPAGTGPQPLPAYQRATVELDWPNDLQTSTVGGASRQFKAAAASGSETAEGGSK